jgi:hypothetical protein
MIPSRQPILRVVRAACLSLLVVPAACGGGPSVATDPPGHTQATATTVGTTAPAAADDAVVEDCEEGTTEVAFGVSFVGEVQAEQRLPYFCVQLPPGLHRVTIELTGLTGDLAVFGALDTDTVRRGGMGTWTSGGRDGGDRVEATRDLGPNRSFEAGPLYIDVFRQSVGGSPFALLVTGE